MALGMHAQRGMNPRATRETRMFKAFVPPRRGFKIYYNDFPPLTQWATIVLPLTGHYAYCTVGQPPPLDIMKPDLFRRVLSLPEPPRPLRDLGNINIPRRGDSPCQQRHQIRAKQERRLLLPYKQKRCNSKSHVPQTNGYITVFEGITLLLGTMTIDSRIT